jgi:hypothetical protein
MELSCCGSLTFWYILKRTIYLITGDELLILPRVGGGAPSNIIIIYYYYSNVPEQFFNNMMKEAIDWKTNGSNLKRRIRKARINGDQRIWGIDWEPLKDKPCFYSTEMVRELQYAEYNINNRAFPSSWFPVSESVSKLVQEGKRQESSEEIARLKELKEKFLNQVRAHLQSEIEKFMERVASELTLKFCLSEDVVILFKEFSDGRVDDDKVLLERIEAIIRRMAREKPEDR